jgi:glycosyltransferase involved in cell wall biosynthesis
VAEIPLVSVIIPTHQRRDSLRRALASLSRQSVPSDSYEVIVSVDGSTDGTSEMLAEFAAPYALRAVSSRRRGRASACNAAIAAARGEVLVVLDDDMQVVPHFVERHRRHHPPGSLLCVLGPVPVELNGASPRAARYVKAKFDAHLAALAQRDHVYGARDFYSGNASLRTEVLREVGGFDESFTRYGNEDVDLSLRLRAAGVTLRYDSEALARQEYAKDLRGLAADSLAKGHTAVLVARTHPYVFGDLRLAAPGDGSRPWLAARAVLLRLTRRWSDTAAVVFAVAAMLERLGLWRQPLFYRALLDYAFWAGVDDALHDSTDEGDLERLAAELHRGPIDLLLHG